MTGILDCRGLSCPQPVLNTKKALDMLPPGETLTVQVDGKVPAENVKRFAESQGYLVTVAGQGEGAELRITKQRGEPGNSLSPASEQDLTQKAAPCHAMKTAVTAYINSDCMGKGPEELGKILMRAFIKTIPEVEPPITKVIFVNQGVQLAVTGSPLVDSLKELEEKGIEIHSCGTCLDYFGLLNEVKVGKVSNMYDIVTILALSERVIKP